MPPKKKGKGRRAGRRAPRSSPRRRRSSSSSPSRNGAEQEAKRRYEEEQAAREATLVLREEALAKREQDALSLEVEYKNKLEGIDSEVALRARSGIAAAEAREAASERRAVMRETECQQRESCFAAAERELAVRSIEIAAREAAMGENVIGGVAERLDKMLSEQAVTRDTMLTRHKEIERERAALKVREANWQEEVAKMEAQLAAKEREAKARLEKEEKKVLQKDFTLKRRLQRRVREAEAIAEAHSARCATGASSPRPRRALRARTSGAVARRGRGDADAAGPRRAAASAGPVRAEEAWAAAVADGPAPAADEPAPVYTIRQHEFDIPEFKTNPDDKTPQGLRGSNAYSNADY
ncbi:hypothetical protein JL720_11155 [Aureococcus anophagefferens]|nr:hypothetical protein JL720_11155 [Aureococcus anophagefferens]